MGSVIAAMASCGLPGFANFVAELLVILGTWDRYPVPSVLAVLGIVITSIYMLRMVRGTFFGELPKAYHQVQDARTPFTRLPYVVLIAALLVVGCWPGPLVRLIDSSARPFVKSITHGAQR
jgi:NADH-quinone oxidoreductase subunit M